MPAHNAAPFLQEALRSLAAMDRCDMDMEVVFVNDGSSDQTQEVAESLFHELELPVKLLANDKPTGPGFARRMAIESSGADIVLGVDADDLVRPNRLRDVLRVMEDPRVLCGCTDLAPFVHGRPLQSMPIIKLPEQGDDIAAAALFMCPLWGGATHLRDRLIGQFEFPTERLAEDWVMAHRIVQQFGPSVMRNTGTVGCDHRRHPKQTTSTPGADSTLVLPVWRLILNEALGLEPSDEELELHALVGPYAFKPTPRLTDGQWHAWKVWSARLIQRSAELHRAAKSTAKFVEALDGRLARVRESIP